jgi:endoglucanase
MANELTGQQVSPRWRGFNLLEMFRMNSTGDWAEDDFRWIAEWGFNFVRLPCCFRVWIEDGDPYRFKEAMLAKLDRAVELGGKYGLHVCINLHRAPGYCVNPDFAEPYSLWKDTAALEAFCLQWGMLARRYAGVPSSALSFNLLNEPSKVSHDDHERVVRCAVAAVREADSRRRVVIDGVEWGNECCPELADLPNIVLSTRAYQPLNVSHYKATWVKSDGWDVPSWPGRMADGRHWDRRRLEEFYRPWVELAGRGTAVHCGEGGALRFTPHAVVLAWLRDVLEVLGGAGIGLALWNFRGAFGVLDSERADVAYEDWHGHKLDRELLELMREY